MIDLELFKNIMAEARHNDDLLDSYSPNQFKTKERLINHIKKLNIIGKNSKIVIMGGWYGSILIPAFKECKEITLIDKDNEVVSIAKNRLFHIIKM
jgi:tRNA A37 threonylcarbamoyladenosine dehydratase